MTPKQEKDLIDMFEDLLSDSMSYYHLHPNNHRKTVEEYYKNEIALLKIIKEQEDKK